MILASLWFWSRPSWGWAEFWALLALGLIAFAIRRNGSSLLVSMINGADNRWSTSKTSATLWTFGLLFAFLAIAFHTRGHGLDNLTLDNQYVALLGIPAAAAVGAKAIKQSKVDPAQPDQGKQASKPTVSQGVGNLLSDDAGEADLLDTQYFLFSLLLLGYFLLQFLTNEATTLPTLPGTLVGLTGVSAAGYLAKKGTEPKL